MAEQDNETAFDEPQDGAVTTEQDEQEEQEEDKPFEVPEGFEYVTESTKAGKVEYEIRYLTSGGKWQVWENYLRSRNLDPHEVAAKYLDEIQTQRATQGGKTAVRDADTDEARSKAIARHQRLALRFLLAAPRTKAPGGVTKKRAADFGSAVIAGMADKGRLLTPDEMRALATEYGVDPSLLNV